MEAKLYSPYQHLFTDILTIAILAVMSRANDWSEIVLYARSRLRKDHGAENFSRLRRIAMNQLRKQPEQKNQPQRPTLPLLPRSRLPPETATAIKLHAEALDGL